MSAHTPHESLKQHLNQLRSETELFDSYVRFLIEMHEKGFMHGNQNLSNILFYKKDGAYKFEVIDINRSHFITTPTKEDCLNNLMRITRNRELSKRVVERYAEFRGWDKAECVAFVFKAIDRYERRRKLRKAYHKLFPNK